MNREKIYQVEIFSETYESLDGELEKIMNISHPDIKIDTIKAVRNKLLSFWKFSRKLMEEYDYADKEFYMKHFNLFFVDLDELCDNFDFSLNNAESCLSLKRCVENFYRECFSRISIDFIPFVNIRIFGENIYTGVRFMDAQHKALFLFIDKFVSRLVRDSTQGDVNKVLAFLEKYSQKHFKDEESFMEKSRYPKIVNHKGEHQSFINTLKELKLALKPENYSSLIEGIYTAVAEWLIKHILISDKDFTEYYKKYEREV